MGFFPILVIFLLPRNTYHALTSSLLKLQISGAVRLEIHCKRSANGRAFNSPTVFPSDRSPRLPQRMLSEQLLEFRFQLLVRRISPRHGQHCAPRSNKHGGRDVCHGREFSCPTPVTPAVWACRLVNWNTLQVLCTRAGCFLLKSMINNATNFLGHPHCAIRKELAALTSSEGL